MLNHGRSYDATFGSVNQDVGDLVVPVGPDNTVTRSPAARGQPQALRPGFVDAAFTVRGVSAARTVSWRLTIDGQARIATATARRGGAVVW